jgi:hypothetical protein
VAPAASASTVKSGSVSAAPPVPQTRLQQQPLQQYGRRIRTGPLPLMSLDALVQVH